VAAQPAPSGDSTAEVREKGQDGAMSGSTLLDRLGVTLPVLAAPMAGGPTTPALVLAAAEAGSLGFLAAGYQQPQAFADQVASVAAETEAYGVNLFAPHPVPVDPVAYAAYRAALRPLAERFGVDLPEQPLEDDDHWRAKVDVLVAAAPRFVSFTFGLPDPGSVTALHRAGSLLAQTVTSTEEATAAEEAGLDVLVVQAPSAGGHSGTFTPARPLVDRPLPALVAEIAAATSLPILAAGGVVRAEQVSAARAAGAAAVAVGTALLLSPEAGTAPANRSALTRGPQADTALTRSFTGRPGRGVPNAFMARYDATAPLGYPALHHLTAPIRRASAAQGDAEQVNVWAGSGYREITERPTGEILRALSAGG
jgi:NAD(P)H-dependent flavin oxidoreductase YrpB (nitropropane dioxygenase family)